MVGRVTTAISAPVAALSRSARSVIRASAAWSTIPATSVTYPVGRAGKSDRTAASCARSSAGGQLKRRQERDSFGSCPAQ